MKKIKNIISRSCSGTWLGLVWPWSPVSYISTIQTLLFSHASIKNTVHCTSQGVERRLCPLLHCTKRNTTVQVEVLGLCYECLCALEREMTATAGPTRPYGCRLPYMRGMMYTEMSSPEPKRSLVIRQPLSLRTPLARITRSWAAIVYLQTNAKYYLPNITFAPNVGQPRHFWGFISFSLAINGSI